ncbi:hypothetical protein QYE76_005939 [Lolium multiflorum]|uniref:Uncharacterized protein n=1 Tax=Lolium multiflorum TaxID=4521 RepID=A0AAD8W2R5_LOLMU|nr:hypothetical protein QYE76_005939 [Lolium multiflorum]
MLQQPPPKQRRPDQLSPTVAPVKPRLRAKEGLLRCPPFDGRARPPTPAAAGKTRSRCYQDGHIDVNDDDDDRMGIDGIGEDDADDEDDGDDDGEDDEDDNMEEDVENEKNDDKVLSSDFFSEISIVVDNENGSDYGDMVVFDSTYKMNRYGVSFVPLVGLNNHRKTTIVYDMNPDTAEDTTEDSAVSCLATAEE